MDDQGVKFQMIVQNEAKLDRDRALVAFLRARIAERAPTTDERERQLLAGTKKVLDEFAANFERAMQVEPTDYFLGQIDALGWSLRCTTFAAYSEHPDFQMDFKP